MKIHRKSPSGRGCDMCPSLWPVWSFVSLAPPPPPLSLWPTGCRGPTTHNPLWHGAEQNKTTATSHPRWLASWIVSRLKLFQLITPPVTEESRCSCTHTLTHTDTHTHTHRHTHTHTQTHSQTVGGERTRQRVTIVPLAAPPARVTRAFL